MSLPIPLKLAIEKETRTMNSGALTSASQQVSHRYRQQRKEILDRKQHFLINDAQRMAYIAARMPATFGAVQAVLKQIKARYAGRYHHIVDIGAGPGTALWAASEVFPEISHSTLLERDSSLITLGKKLAQYSDTALIKQAKWLQGDATQIEEFPENDLTILSYTLGEWPVDSQAKILQKLWTAAKQCLVIIEPGTMEGFGVIRRIRQQLIDWGAFMIAPCPHTLPCPMPANDWCHFSVRVERSRLHKQAKEGSLGYEDEKFSYVAVGKSSVDLPEARILRHPQKRSGHVSFTLCTKQQGLINKIFSRREGELYKKARDLEWGDAIDS